MSCSQLLCNSQQITAPDEIMSHVYGSSSGKHLFSNFFKNFRTFKTHDEIGFNHVYTHITAVSTNKSVTEHIIHICIFHTASSKIHYTACILETITSMYLDV
jgi:hypothetical protein